MSGIPPPTEPIALEAKPPIAAGPYANRKNKVSEVWYRWLSLVQTRLDEAAYAEGTFTPTLTTTGTDFASVTYDQARSGFYTKIGRHVFFTAAMKTDAVDATGATGIVSIGGLPYTASGSANFFHAVTIGYVAAWAGEMPSGAIIPGAGTLIRLYYRIAADGASNASAVADVATGANGNEIYISGSYLATE
jgi:hypothetical protein